MSQTRFLATDADIPTARDEFARWLQVNAPHLGEKRAYEMVLVANELFCNAFEHGDGGGCLFAMRRLAGHLTVAVTNDAVDADLGPTDEWTMADADARTGRGLAIVRALADEVSTQTSPRTVTVAASFDLRDRTSDTAAVEATLAW